MDFATCEKCIWTNRFTKWHLIGNRIVSVCCISRGSGDSTSLCLILWRDSRNDHEMICQNMHVSKYACISFELNRIAVHSNGTTVSADIRVPIDLCEQIRREKVRTIMVIGAITITVFSKYWMQVLSKSTNTMYIWGLSLIFPAPNTRRDIFGGNDMYLQSDCFSTNVSFISLNISLPMLICISISTIGTGTSFKLFCWLAFIRGNLISLQALS